MDYDDRFEPVFIRGVRSSDETVGVVSWYLKFPQIRNKSYLQPTQFKSLTRGYWDPKRGKRSPQVGKCYKIFNRKIKSCIKGFEG